MAQSRIDREERWGYHPRDRYPPLKVEFSSFLRACYSLSHTQPPLLSHLTSIAWIFLLIDLTSTFFSEVEIVTRMKTFETIWIPRLAAQAITFPTDACVPATHSSPVDFYHISWSCHAIAIPQKLHLRFYLTILHPPSLSGHITSIRLLALAIT